jgi:hypothetical protein
MFRVALLLLTPFGLLALVALVRVLFFTVRYQLAVRKIPASIPRQKTWFPILMWLNLRGGYEEYIAENQDEDGNPYPVINSGPQLDGSVILSFSSTQILSYGSG